jgi:hypothetical protein
MQIIEWDGRQISKPGCYSKIPLPTYHRGDICVGPSVSSSSFRKVFCPKMGGSPAHYWAYSPLNPKRLPEPEKEAFIIGRALHHLALGEPFFNKLFVQQPDEINGRPWSGAGCDPKAREKWKAEQATLGKTILKGEQIDRLVGMSEQMGKNPEISDGLLAGYIERSLFWVDKETGLWFKARPDSIPRADFQFSDLKITTSTHWYEMQKTIYDWGYFMQAALVGEGCQHVFGQPMTSFTFVFVEHHAPYCVDTVPLKDNDLARGHAANHQAARKIAHGLKTGEWPGPGGVGLRPIEMSERAQKSIDEQLQFGEQQ